jgi:hypothetical protein
MRQEIRAGGSLDILTKSELTEAMGHKFDEGIRDLLRGLDFMTFTGNGSGQQELASGAQVLTIPGPESGYTWSLKTLSVHFVMATGTTAPYAFTVSIGDSPDTGTVYATGGNDAFVDDLVYVANWSSNQAVVKGGRNITIAIQGNPSTFLINNWFLAVQQVPTEMQGKL